MYSKGAGFERQVKSYLERNGWWTVIRSAGSHSAVDLVAIGESCLLVQCKVEKKKRSYKADEALLMAVGAPAGWQRMLFIKRLSREVVIRNVETGGESVLPLRLFRD